MELPDDLDALEAELDPATRYIVKLLRQNLEEMKAMLFRARRAWRASLTIDIEGHQRGFAEGPTERTVKSGGSGNSNSAPYLRRLGEVGLAAFLGDDGRLLSGQATTHT
jgi:hypothetical protein